MASISLGEYYGGGEPEREYRTGYDEYNYNASQMGLSPTPPTTSGGYSSVAVSNTQRQPSSTTTRTTAIAPSGSLPSFGNVPAIDEARIRRLTQTRSAASQRALRSALRETLLNARYADNPNVAALIGKKALEGFGQGVAESYTRAQEQATREEAADRQMEFSKQQAVFNAAMQDYLKRFGTESVANYSYENPQDQGYLTLNPKSGTPSVTYPSTRINLNAPIATRR